MHILMHRDHSIPSMPITFGQNEPTLILTVGWNLFQHQTVGLKPALRRCDFLIVARLYLLLVCV